MSDQAVLLPNWFPYVGLSLWVIKLFFCQNDVLIGGSFWQKDNLISWYFLEYVYYDIYPISKFWESFSRFMDGPISSVKFCETKNGMTTLLLSRKVISATTKLRTWGWISTGMLTYPSLKVFNSNKQTNKPEGNEFYGWPHLISERQRMEWRHYSHQDKTCH